MSVQRRLSVDSLWNAMLDAKAACAVRGPAWCFRNLDLARDMEDAQRAKIMTQAGALGLTNDGDVIRILEGGR